MKKNAFFLLLIITINVGGQNIYQYDLLNRVTSVVLSNGNQIQYNYDALGNRIARTITYTRPPVQSFVNVTVSTGQAKCFEAAQTLSIAGNGTTFLVQSGANVTLVAGQKISLFPGTTSQNAGYLHGYITTNGQFCAILKSENTGPTAKENDQATAPEETGLSSSGDVSFKVFPNPTTGVFTLDLSDDPNGTLVNVQIYNLTPCIIIEKNIYKGKLHEFSLAGQIPGMFLVRVTQLGETGLMKIIKY
jgi:YD repeat-containing protein